jgi:prepilin-type N-terminal cleavage/methylation domain-containing protein
MIFYRFRLINKDQRGFSLIEFLTALGITAIIGAVITLTLFQVITGSTRTNNHMTALTQVQSAGFWMSNDTQMAQIINPPSGGFPLTLTWTEWGDGEPNGNQHNVVYTLLGDELQRQHVITDTGGTVIEDSVAVVAEHITGSTCNVTSGLLSFTVTATVQGQSETRTYEVVPRPDPDSSSW